jgi:hypothetical protein
MGDLPIGEPPLPELPDVGPSPRLAFSELERAVRAADPAAFLILPRILRRVIKQDCRLTGFGLRVPHRKSYVIGREPLLAIVEKDELGLTDDAELPEKVVLLARPDPQTIADTPADALLIGCWRLLFHARIHAALEEQAAAGRLSPAVVRQRIGQLGSAEFDEIRMVLGQEDLLLPPRSDVSIYIEFIAVYLELRYFAGGFVPHCFPGLENPAAVDELIRQDVDADRLFGRRGRGARPANRGLVHFSARGRIPANTRKPKTWTCPLPRRKGDSPIFAAKTPVSQTVSLTPRKSGQPPVSARKNQARVTQVALTLTLSQRERGPIDC